MAIYFGTPRRAVEFSMEDYTWSAIFYGTLIGSSDIPTYKPPIPGLIVTSSTAGSGNGWFPSESDEEWFWVGDHGVDTSTIDAGYVTSFGSLTVRLDNWYKYEFDRDREWEPPEEFYIEGTSPAYIIGMNQGATVSLSLTIWHPIHGTYQAFFETDDSSLPQFTLRGVIDLKTNKVEITGPPGTTQTFEPAPPLPGG